MSRFIIAFFAGVVLLCTLVAAPLPEQDLPALEATRLLSINTDFEEVRVIAFSPDGKRVIAGSDGTATRDEIGVWDTETGKRVLKIEPQHDLYTSSVTFSPDGKHIACAGGSTGLVRIWDSNTGALVKSFKGHRHEVHSVAYSPDGKRIVSAGGEDVKLWDVQSGKMTDLIRHGRGAWASVAKFSGTGNRIILCIGATIRIFNPDSGKQTLEVSVGRERVRGMALDRDGERFVTAGHELPVKLWDAETGKELRTFSRLPLSDVKFSPDNKWLIGAVYTGSSDTSGWVLVWDVATGKELANFRAVNSHPEGMDLSPDGTRLAIGGGKSVGGPLSIWSLRIKR